MEKLVSIIVPVYNSEKYIEKCIDSILGQTYKNIEVLLIDDGSTDNSLEKCKLYADKRIRVITGNNYGVSHARNIGLRNSNGEYIAFVDSDDYCERNMIETLVNLIQDKDLSIISSYSERVYNNVFDERDTVEFNAEEAIKELHIGILYQGQVWGKLFKKDIISTLRFEQNLFINEDMVFVQRYLTKCKSIIYQNDKLYFYRINMDSALLSGFKSKDLSAREAAFIMKQEGMEKFPQLLEYYNKSIIVSDNYIINKLLREKNFNISLLKRLRKEIKSVTNRKSLDIFIKATNGSRLRYFYSIRFFYLRLIIKKIKNIKNGIS